MSAPIPPMAPVPDGYVVEVIPVAVNYKWWLNQLQDLWDLNFTIPNLNIGSGTTYAGAAFRCGIIATAYGAGGGAKCTLNDFEIFDVQGETLSQGYTYYMPVSGNLNNGFNKVTLHLYHVPLTALAQPVGYFTAYLEVYYLNSKPTPPTVNPPPSDGGGGFPPIDWTWITNNLPLIALVTLGIILLPNILAVTRPPRD